MVLQEKLQKIDRLKEELDSLKPIPEKQEKELWKKFRLEWNYNSNHIEGNTLTYGQTKLLLFFDKTTGDHDFREYEEMKAHDVAVHMIRDWVNEERELTEVDVKDLNKLILVKPFWKEAITPDGQQTRRLIKIGEYKEHPNSVILQSGEVFEYTDPVDVPKVMSELISWLREEDGLHPLVKVAELHYRFVRIHPFDDGNGRIARLLANYVLMREDYPPIVVKTKDKKGYLTALNKADVGDIEAFHKYMADQLIWSLELSIKAAKGESVEEPDDIDKEISLLKKELYNKGDSINSKTLSTILEIYDTSIKPLIESVHNKLMQFDDLFALKETRVTFDHRHIKGLEPLQILDNKFKEIRSWITENPDRADDESIPQRFEINHIMYWLRWKRFIKGKNPFDLILKLTIKLEYNEYIISSDEKNILNNRRRSYDEHIMQEEVDEIANIYAKYVIGVIRKNTG